MEMYRKDIQGLLSFLADSPTAFHTVDNFARMLRRLPILGSTCARSLQASNGSGKGPT